MSYDCEWEEFLEVSSKSYSGSKEEALHGLAREAAGLGHPSDKLVYLYLVLAEPQTFTGIRQGLEIIVKTVDRALRRLRERGYVVQDIK